MLSTENKIINKFINGTLPTKQKDELVNKIKHAKLTDKKEQIVFNEDIAWEKLNKKISTTQKHKKRLKINNYLPYAASIILLLGISIFAYFSLNINNSKKYSDVSSFQEIKEVILPDGSHVTLNKNSTIKFPKKFSNKNRVVEFTGEAFFRISKNKLKPFIIKSNNAEITVLGTSFNVKAKNKKKVSVTVKTGKVKLENNKKEHIILVAGDLGEIKNSKIYKKKNTNKNFLSWKTKQFNYNGEKISKVIADFNNVYGVNIITSNKNIDNLQITTQINSKDVNIALKIICEANNLEYSINGKNIILSEK